MARPVRLETLEGRTFLTSGIATLEAVSVAEVAQSVPLAQDLVSSRLEFSNVVVRASATSSRAMPWRISMSYPWRVTTWLPTDGTQPVDLPGGPDLDLPLFSPEFAQILPETRESLTTGEIGLGDQGHLFGVPIGPGTRAFRFSYTLRDLDPQAGALPVRVWMGDAEGNLIDSWWFEASSERLEVRMLALVPTEPTVLYIGIEVGEAPASTTTLIPYVLEVQFAQPSSSSWFPASGQFQAESPALDDGFPIWGGMGQGATAQLGSVGLPNAVGGGNSGITLAPSLVANVSIRVAEANVSIPNGFGGGLVRPLPIQSASSVGGLLSAGPAIRGEGESPDRVARVDEFADALLMLAEAIASEGPQERSRGELAGPSEINRKWIAADVLGEQLVATNIPDPGAGMMGLMPGSGGVPMLVAGLRIAWGKPPVLDTGPTPPEVPDDLVASVATLPPSPHSEPYEGIETRPEDDSGLDPTRPRVLRTALIGAAALAVGLFLPDLASDRPLLRRTRRLANFQRWFFRV